MTQVEKDPAPDRRVYYRNNATADRGYMVKRYGADHIKLDRGPGTDETKLFRSDEWTQEARSKRFAAHEVAQIAYVADCRLWRSLGNAKESKREWISLPEEERIRFLSEGPKVSADHRRARLWRAIVGALTDDD